MIKLFYFKNCQGKLRDGTIVDDHSTLVFNVGEHEVVEGLDLAVRSMHKNELSIVSVKPEAAYGELGRKGDVPAGARITYLFGLMHFEKQKEVNLTKIKPMYAFNYLGIFLIPDLPVDLGPAPQVRAIQNAPGQLVVPAQRVPGGSQVLQARARVLQQHPDQPGVLHRRGVQGAAAADGGAAQDHAAGRQHLQEDRKPHPERADQLVGRLKKP